MTNQNNMLPVLLGWGNSQADKLKVVNSEDLRSEELVKLLGLSKAASESMGICDRDAIINRQELVRISTKYTKLMQKIGDICNKNVDVPYDGDSFIREFAPTIQGKNYSSLFSKKLKVINDILLHISEKENLVGDIKIFSEHTDRFLKEFIVTEREFAKKAEEEVEKIVNLQGTVKVRLRPFRYGYSFLNVVKTETYGYKKYSLYTTGRTVLIEKPIKWKDWHWLMFNTIFFPCAIYVFLENKRRSKMLKEKMIVSETPINLIIDIGRWVVEEFLDVVQTGSKPTCDNEDGGLAFELKDGTDFELMNDICVNVAYTYDALNKLRVHVIDVEKEDFSDLTLSNLKSDEFDSSFAGYTKKEIGNFNDKLNSMKLSTRSSFTHSSIIHKVLIKAYSDKRENVFGWNSIDFPNTKIAYMYDSLRDIYSSSDITEHFKHVRGYRMFVRKFLDNLLLANEYTKCIFNFAKANKLPICFPEILPSNEHKIFFDELYPIHLMLNGKTASRDLMPIKSLPVLNGQIISLTGANGGGKTVTLVELAYAVYMAQSGFPVFGKGFSLNPKKILGMVFIERGEGSTLELVMNKTKKVFEAIQEAPGNECLVLLDELGTGTQEIGGLDLGIKILSSMSSKKVSVLYNTQISELAQFADKNLNGISCKINTEHEISKGIGKGEPEKLADKVGLTEFLN